MKENKEKELEKPEFKTGKKQSLQAGLYLVATPIGNLRDISLRALDVLDVADVIYCEDTRVTRKLLSAFQIKGRLCSYNDHSDETRRREIISHVADGQVVVYVSDAGMPVISDPGYRLVKAMREEGLYVTSVPGANAPLTALQLSALPSDQFCFLGFLPSKSKSRKDVLSKWEDVPATLIAFETAPRLKASLTDALFVLGNRQAAIVREITKLYEEVRTAPLEDLVAYYQEHGAPKGEIVLVIEPPQEKQISEADAAAMLKEALQTMKSKDAAKYVAEKTGIKKSDLYDMALVISKGDLS